MIDMAVMGTILASHNYGTLISVLFLLIVIYLFVSILFFHLIWCICVGSIREINGILYLAL